LRRPALSGRMWPVSWEEAGPLEPVFGQIKTVQGGGRFMRRGLRACAAEWQLLCGTHNLLKLWRTTTAITS
jgi:hypothetical protein